ncbi:MAG TPA: GNAT family N-acetyltransferase [Anaerolineales bacterium]|jgi:GNAT superfamily N-acetyltransferase
MKAVIRPYQPADFDAIVILWRVARELSLPDIQLRKGHALFEDIAYLREHVLPRNQVWVAQDESGHPIGFMAMQADFIDLLYIHPEHWRKGLGGLFLEHARRLSPAHLWLYTLQVNTNARAFYEKNGFRAVEFGTSPPPENEPDVKYAWAPGI